MDEPIMAHFMADTLEDGLEDNICTHEAGYCSDSDDDAESERDEL